MKRQEAIALGIPESLIDEQDVDIGQLVVAKEFARKIPLMDRSGDCYRKRAIASLVQMRTPFSTDGNIGTDAIKLWLRPSCPYCGCQMEHSRSSGNGSYSFMTWRCDCGAELSLDVPANHALTVRPPKVQP